jgi:hypothetical protein
VKPSLIPASYLVERKLEQLDATPDSYPAERIKLDDALLQLDAQAGGALALIAKQAGRHNSTHPDHSRLSSLELAIADLMTALRLAS